MAKHIFKSTLAVRDTFVLPNASAIQWFPGHMKKGLDRIMSSLHQIDAVLEIHDARIPFSGRNPQLKEIIHVRPHLMILNKCDLADMSKKDQICQKLQDEGVRNVYFASSTGRNIHTCIKKDIVPMMLKEIEERPRYRTDIMNDFNIMVVGIPNVGKSTLLNKLRQTYTTKRKCARVGALPGVTRAVMNKVRVNFDPPMFVVDTPGILNPRIPNVDTGMRLALCDCLPNRLVGEDIIADYLLYWLNKHENFSYVKFYQLDGPTDNVMDFLSAVAMKNRLVIRLKALGFDKPKYRIDFIKAAHCVIKDFQLGHFGKVLFDDDLLN